MRYIFFILVNYLTVLFLLAGIWVSVAFGQSWTMRILLFVGWIYLIPPLLTRVILIVLGKPGSTPHMNSRSYRTWYFLTQLQSLFSRLSILESMLRLVPGLYNIWLNLWGSSVHLLTYWGPKVVVTDRYLLHIERSAVLGTECILGSHVLTKSEDTPFALTLGVIRIGAEAIIGSRAIIGPGAYIHQHEIVGAGERIPPFNEYKAGKRIKPATESTYHEPVIS